MSAARMMLAIKARLFWKSLGHKVAVGYLKNRGFTLEETIQALGLPRRFS